MEAAITDGRHIGIYGKLGDRFGDNGLVSVVLGRIDGHDLYLDLWLMSCRVLKRDMELSMLDRLVECARIADIRTIYGGYLPTPKNEMVADHYEKIGFVLISKEAETGASTWSLDITHYEARNRHMSISELSNG
jgi:FkbH-like protein